MTNTRVGDLGPSHKRMRVAVVPRAPHGFVAIAGGAEVAPAFHARARDWLGERLAAGTPS